MNMKHLYKAPFVFAMVAILGCNGASVAHAESTDVVVSVEATIIDVTVTPSLSISIDPNTGAITKDDITIANNTVAPILVETAGLTETDGTLALVAPTKYTDWDKLTKAESKDIAMTLTADTGWKNITNAALTTGTAGTLSGSINPSESGVVTVSNFYHGNSFEAATASTFQVTWVFSLE